VSFNIKVFNERLEAKNKFDANLILGAKKFHSITSRIGSNRPLGSNLIPAHAKVVEDTGIGRYKRIDDFWESVENCPVCMGKNKTFCFERLGLRICKCEDCKHRFINPRINYEKVTELYEDDRVAVSISTSSVQQDIDRIKYKYGLDLIDQIRPPSKERILDLGCGVGVSLEVAGQMGWEQSVGVDINKSYGETFDNTTKGIQFINSNFDEIDPFVIGDGYDCVTLWNVLEHLYDLDGMMIKLNKILNQNGLLLVLVPNIESLALRLFREKGSTFSWPHVSHFSIKSLRFLMDKHYFKEEFIETVITEIDNIKSYMSGEHPYHGYGDPDGLFDFITPEYIHRNFLGSRILAIYRKT